MRLCVTLILAVMLSFTMRAAADSRTAILTDLTNQAKAADPAFTGFSTERGAAFFTATHTGGKPDTPSCTTCHGTSPQEPGKTRAGKVIAPLAVSKTPDRYTDAAKVAKWFQRNCTSVLGRDCMACHPGAMQGDYEDAKLP